jgi:hypothetical protein
VSSNPWLKFYPRDWRGDQALRAVSVAARGLWIEMLCIMHEASPYGHLILGGRAVSNDVLARVSGLGAEECNTLVAELESAGVFSRTRKAVIYSRRMVKDHSRSEKGRKSIARRWKQEPENPQENRQPNSSPNKSPITQKPEARSQKEREDKPLSERAIPDWLPIPEWRGFEAMRRKIKKPMTDRAAAMALRKLSELRDQGEDPAIVLDQSTLHCWQDLYPVREKAKTYDPERITV